jgi:hypothetical protein
LNLNFLKYSINTLKSKYKSIQKTHSTFPLRIIDKELSPRTGDTIYTIQIVGKNLVSKLQATELFNDAHLLAALSPFDLLKFVNISNKQRFYKNSNLLIFPCHMHYKMIAKSYDCKTQETIFTIEIVQANQTMQKKYTALEIVNGPLILEKLSSKENYGLGFAIGSEAVLKEMLKLAYCTNKL